MANEDLEVMKIFENDFSREGCSIYDRLPFKSRSPLNAGILPDYSPEPRSSSIFAAIFELLPLSKEPILFTDCMTRKFFSIAPMDLSIQTFTKSCEEFEIDTDVFVAQCGGDWIAAVENFEKLCVFGVTDDVARVVIESVGGAEVYMDILSSSMYSAAYTHPILRSQETPYLKLR